VAAVTAIRIPVIQQKATAIVTAWLSDQLQTRISVKALGFEPFNRLVLHDVFIADQQQDTLLYARVLRLNITGLNIKDKQMNLHTLGMADAVIHTVRNADDRSMNFDFILSHLSRSDKDTLATSPWHVSIRQLSLVNLHFTYRDLKYAADVNRLSFEDLSIHRFYADLRNIVWNGHSLSLQIKDLSFQEQSGLVLRQLSIPSVRLTPDSLVLENYTLLTQNSSFSGQLAFAFNRFSDFKDFAHRVQIVSAFENCRLNVSDLAFIIPALKGVDQSLSFSVKIRGTLSQLKLRDCLIQYGHHTRFAGRINLNGLPRIKETYIALMVDELTTSSTDLALVPMPPFGPDHYLHVPTEIKRLGKIRFNGQFTGFYNDFVSYGTIVTDLGSGTTDVNLKFDTLPVYSGKLMLNNFHLGKFLDSPSLGWLSLNAALSGKYFDLKRLQVTVNGNISRLDVRNYPYSNLTVSANLSRRFFNGQLQIDDPHLSLLFRGSIDFSKDIPRMDFTADLNRANLSALHLAKPDAQALLRLHSDIKLKGRNLDDITGSIRLSDIFLSLNNRTVELNELVFHSLLENSRRQLWLKSESADMTLDGLFELAVLPEAFINLLQRHFPVSIVKSSALIKPQDVAFTVRLKKIQPLMDLLFPGMEIADGTRLNGRFMAPANTFSVHLVSDRLKWGPLIITGSELNGFTEEEDFYFHYRAPHASFRDSLVFRQVSIQGKSSYERAIWQLMASGRDSATDHVNLHAQLLFQQYGVTRLEILENRLMVAGQPWSIRPDHKILFDTTGISVSNLIVQSGMHQVAMSGLVSTRTDKPLEIVFNQFPLPSLNKILSTYKFSLGGLMDGMLRIRQLTTRPVLQSDLMITSFCLFKDTLGDARIKADFPTGDRQITARMEISRQQIRNLLIEGSYDLHADKVNARIDLNKLSAAPFGHYLSSFASQVRGFATGEVTLSGPVRQLQLQGKIKLQKAALTINYLNCRYSFSDEVTITPAAFVFQNITVHDSLNNTAQVSGQITHQHFRDFRLYLNIRTRHLMVLNTTARHNQLFFGTGFASGQMTIAGPFKQIAFDGSLRTEKGTEISIPLSNPEEITQGTFISFLSSDTARQVQTITPVDLSKISMRLDVNATDEALIKLIYDEKIGDKLEGRGHGNLVFEITKDEVFTMRGDYTITEGNYVFTLQNVINKRFYLQPGGTIRWNGSPYEATVNLDAVYRTRASLFDLLQDSSEMIRKRIPVHILLALRNRLLSPDISFQIEIPNIDPSTQNLVAQAISTDESKSKQTLSLLVMNRFLPGDNRTTTFEPSSSGFSANASELLSIQLTNWISQLTDKVDIGINYRAADKLNSDQLEIMLATRFFNDRVMVETNVGFTGNNAPAGQPSTHLVGDFNVDVKLTDDGRFHFKAFNRSNNINFLNSFNSLYTQGIGFYYKQEFNNLREVFAGRKDD
jgi:hypothetical protein